ncbi:LLM class flavin-dependent oxidoreductase [Prauserella sp. ASG 168]|uniref:LLM class flavin-dependent oxidoreductase n=2 Tax=Prauserella cavernicola TaxID=2800127 RepID=A0A934V7Q2_9PSEU|nr:LLM class flavin-dependent oxidoreductase [Prauserella cavernicola]
MGLGMHLGAWRHREGAATDYLDLDYYTEIAKVAEDAKLHAVFLSDTLALSEENLQRPNLGALDPVVVLSALAASTSRIGLIATSSTTFNEPYNLARRLASLDQLSRGRAGWNAVTTFVPDVAANFGTAALAEHDRRYEQAEEFVDVVVALWRSWLDGALVGDKAGGVFADPARVHPINHAGDRFTVRGPLTLPRSPQGHPVLVQAGSSERGRALAARSAEIVFTAQNTLAAAWEFSRDLKARAQALGRDPDDLKVLPGIVPIVGSTRAEAQHRKAELDRFAGDAELVKLAVRVGVPVSALDLDKPLPVELIRANTEFNASHGFRDAAVRLTEEEGLTVRELLYRNGGGHLQVVGTAEDVADELATWFTSGAADGFNLMIDELPSGLCRFTDGVVPLLRERGLFQHDYTGRTLRENLGLRPPPDTPENP